jgi:hypothetical protein
MRKTNPLHFFTFGLQRTAGPYRWVNRVGLTPGPLLPVHPNQRTSQDRPEWSGLRQLRTCDACWSIVDTLDAIEMVEELFL